MNVDLGAAHDFVTTHARNLDRRRFDLLFDGGDPEAVLGALSGYRNPDGGYGWGLEPDLRASESQPSSALHALEVLAEVAPVRSQHAVELCDWLRSVSLPDGGLPFALPIANPAGCAEWWRGADGTASSFQITSIVTANAHRVARHDPAVADHPWLERATEYCAVAVAELQDPHAFELLFASALLDAAGDRMPDASGLLEHLGRFLPTNGRVHVAGGTEDEFLRPLDFAPWPQSAARRLLDPGVIEADLERLTSEQQPDGGWPWVARTFSPASALEWRGYETVRALSVLQKNLGPS